MNRQLLVWMALWMTLTGFAQRTLVVNKGDVQSLLDAISEANRLNADQDAERLYILIPDGYYDLGETTLTRISGNQVALIGQSTEGTIIRNAPERRRGAKLESGILYVSGEIEFTHRRVKDFIKKEAQNQFLKLSRKQAAKIDCHVHEVSIKDTKSRWGSCSTLNNINYNWRLALAPKEVIDYIVAHEVSHLLHQDHSSEFWQCVAELCPNYLQGKNWLKSHGKELYVFE